MADLSDLKITVSADDSDAQQKLGALRETLAQSNEQMAQLANGGRQAQGGEEAVATGAQQATASVGALRTELAGLRDRLTEMQSIKFTLGEMGAAQMVEPIRQTEAEITALEAKLLAVGQASQSAGAAVQASSRTMQSSFVSTASSIDELKAHLVALQEVQARGAAQGIFTPGLAQEIQRTESAIGSLGNTMSLSFGATRSATNELTQVVTMMLGSSVPGISQFAGTAAGLSTSFGAVAAAALPLAAGVAAVTAVAIAGVSAFADYEKSLLRISALTENGKAYIHDYDTGIRELSQHVAVSQRDLADAMYFITSNGLQGKEAMDVLTMSAEASSAGMGKTADIARIVGSAINAYGRENLTAAQATDTLVAAVTAGHVAPETLANSLGRVLPIAAQAGVSFAQVNANIATMTRVGATSEQAVTGLATALQALDAPSKQTKDALADIGISADDMRRMVSENLVQALALLQERTGGNIDTMRQIVPEARALRDVFGTSGAQAASYAEILDQVTNSAGRTGKANQEAATGTAYHMAELNNRFTEMRIEVGEKLAPKLLEFGDDLQAIATGVGMLSSAIGGFARGVIDHFSGIKAAWDQLPEPLKVIAVGPIRYAAGRKIADIAGGGGDQAESGGGSPIEQPLVGPPMPTYGPPMPQPKPKWAPETMASFDDMLRGQQAMAALTSEGQKLVGTMTDINRIMGLGDVSSDAIAQKLQGLTADVAKQGQAWRQAFDPAEAQARNDQLISLSQEYDEAVRHGTDVQREAAENKLAIFLQDMAAKDTATKEQKKQQEEQNAAAAEAKRRQRETYESDPLAGISQAMLRDRDDLIGTAGQVMGDLQNAVSLRGQQGARAAGETFGNEARKWGEELQKASVPGWKDAFDQLIALGQVAVVTGSPEIVSAIHDMLAQGEAAVRDAKIGAAMVTAQEKANLEMLQGQQKFNDAMAQSAASLADQQAQAAQSEADRVYDARASKQVDRLVKADQDSQELLRIRENWAREDVDRVEQHARAVADLEDQQNRAAQDRALQQSRAMADLTQNQQRAIEDTTRARVREDADAEHQYQERIDQIRREGAASGATGGSTAAGASDLTKKLADEDYRYKQDTADRLRKRGEDDSEAVIKRQEAQADATRKAYEQNADAARKAAEASSDLVKREGEQDADKAKARERQLADRTNQNADAIFLRDQRLTYEQQYHVDAEAKAQQRFTDDMLRIDAKYQHEVDAASAAQAQTQAQAEHAQRLAAISAQVKYGGLSEDEGATATNAENTQFTQQLGGIQSALRDQETAVNAVLRDAIAANRPTGGGFTPPQAPGVPALAFPQLSFPAAAQTGGAGIGGGGVSFGDVHITIEVTPGTPEEQGQEIGKSIYKTLTQMGQRAATAGAIPATA